MVGRYVFTLQYFDEIQFRHLAAVELCFNPCAKFGRRILVLWKISELTRRMRPI